MTPRRELERARYGLLLLLQSSAGISQVAMGTPVTTHRTSLCSQMTCCYTFVPSFSKSRSFNTWIWKPITWLSDENAELKYKSRLHLSKNKRHTVPWKRASGHKTSGVCRLSKQHFVQVLLWSSIIVSLRLPSSTILKHIYPKERVTLI